MHIVPCCHLQVYTSFTPNPMQYIPYGSWNTFVQLNPQPLPPGTFVELNPQPLPPGTFVELNPQPLPPRYHY
ncbi:MULTISPECIES: hypothetical protein [Bacillus cereus group]|uniref:Spore coat protein n=1 Tax=Bacillus thuringiensis TaxID=1428 RepID=A0AAW4I4Z0_BACTU|nr:MULTISPECIES: hypothetical protein [Bacillus cereus group]MBN9901705.1 hypothetical protein [Bacillus thuringiensis]MDY7522238.1 hypothetical protein [Bacillus thuringiensis]MEB8797307.1 hypothetical protein [Bacillus cereus]MEB8806324.1 hypothetical protein [Bacillus cereus]MEB8994881.1 hypothetical protein [Bacillus cereus]